MAGPIERAANLLPQFYKKRTFEYKKRWTVLSNNMGLFKKMVIADNCAEFANHIFNNSNDFSGGVLIIGVFFFAIQVYGDFSGYSDIAIGVARLFALQLKAKLCNSLFFKKYFRVLETVAYLFNFMVDRLYFYSFSD